MIAAELAPRIGGDLGFLSVGDVWAEIERLAPSHAGLTLERLGANPDGLVVPLDGQADVGGEAAASLGFDIERQAVASHAPFEAESAPAADASGEGTAPPPAGVDRPPLVRFRAPPFEPPAVDAYSFRLVAGRRLYDRGSVVERSPSLAQLVPGPRLRANPGDLDRLG